MATELYGKVLASIVTDTTKTAGTDWLGSDVQVTRANATVRITVQTDTATIVNLVPNSGSSLHLNGGSNVGADGIYTEEVALDTGRTWNLTSDAASLDVQYLLVQEIIR